MNLLQVGSALARRCNALQYQGMSFTLFFFQSLIFSTARERNGSSKIIHCWNPTDFHWQYLGMSDERWKLLAGSLIMHCCLKSTPIFLVKERNSKKCSVENGGKSRRIFVNELDEHFLDIFTSILYCVLNLLITLDFYGFFSVIFLCKILSRFFTLIMICYHGLV